MIPHISEYIQEELDASGWSRDDLALQMALSAPGGKKNRHIWKLILAFLMDLRDPAILLDPDTAAAIGAAFGTSYRLWRKLHEAWLEQQRAVPIEG